MRVFVCVYVCERERLWVRSYGENEVVVGRGQKNKTASLKVLVQCVHLMCVCASVCSACV